MTKDNSSTKLAVIANDISYIKTEVQDIKQKLEADYITKQEFEPIKKIVYGIVSLILVAVGGAIIKLILIP